MNAPDRIWIDEERDLISWSEGPDALRRAEYIHIDLVNQLKGYTVHGEDCNKNPGFSTDSCTCGLTELLSKIGDS